MDKAYPVRCHILPTQFSTFKFYRNIVNVFKLSPKFRLAVFSFWIHSKYFKQNTINFRHAKTQINCTKKSPEYRSAKIMLKWVQILEMDACKFHCKSKQGQWQRSTLYLWISRFFIQSMLRSGIVYIFSRFKLSFKFDDHNLLKSNHKIYQNNIKISTM